MSIVLNAQSGKAKPDSSKVIRLHGPIKRGPAPLLIIMHEGKKFLLDTITLKNGILDPDYIQSINIPKDKEGIECYGPGAQHGVVVFTLKEEKNNKAFKELKKHLKAL